MKDEPCMAKLWRVAYQKALIAAAFSDRPTTERIKLIEDLSQRKLTIKQRLLLSTLRRP